MTDNEVRYIFVDSDEITNKVGNDAVYVEVQQDIMRADERKGEFIDVELISFNCRNDFYQMNDSNNAVGIRNGGMTTTYTLRNGFPSVLSIDNELKEDLEANTGQTWTVAYSNYTGKITFSSTYTSTPPADLALDFTVDYSCYKMIGFTNAIYPFTIDGNNVSLTAPRVVNLSSRIKALNIRMSLIEDNYESTSNGLNNSDVLATLPVDVAPLQYITLTPTTEAFRTHINSHRVSSFTIRITDSENELAGLNSGFNMVLRLRRVRGSDTQNTALLKEMLDLQQLKWLSKEEKQKKMLKFSI